MNNECPKAHLLLAIISTLFCMPLGVFAILKSSEVKDFYLEGNLQKSLEASQKAKKYAWGGIALFVTFWLIYIAGIVIFALWLGKSLDAVGNLQ